MILLSLQSEKAASWEEVEALDIILKESDLDMSKFAEDVQGAIKWCMVYAFSVGRIEGRERLRNDLKNRLDRELRKARRKLKKYE